MTSQTRTTIEPSDIIAIELECDLCKSRSIKPVKVWQNEDGICRNCGNGWAVTRAPEFQKLVQFVAAINDVIGLNEMKDIPFTIRLELLPEDPKQS